MTSGAEGLQRGLPPRPRMSAEWGPLEELRARQRRRAPATPSRPAAARASPSSSIAAPRRRSLPARRFTAPTRPSRSGLTRPRPYSATKARAEALVREASGDGLGRSSCDRASCGGSAIRRCCPRSPPRSSPASSRGSAAATTRTSITHVDNVVEGLVRAAGQGAGGEAYFVTDGEPVVFREFISGAPGNPGDRASRPHRSRLGRRGACPGRRGGVEAAAAEGLAAADPVRPVGRVDRLRARRLRRRAPSWATSRSSRASRGSPRCVRAQPDSSQTTIVPSTSTASMVIKRPAAPASDSPDAQSAETPSRKPASRTPIATAPHARSERSQRRSLLVDRRAHAPLDRERRGEQRGEEARCEDHDPHVHRVAR